MKLFRNNESKNRYRILLVIRWPVGGIRTFIRYVYNNFNSSIYDYTIIAPDLPELRVLLEDLKNMNISCILLEKDSSNLILIISLFKNILFRKFDLIHSHGFTAGILSALPARISKTKHILTSHDVLLPKQFIGLKGFLKKKTLSLFLPMIDIIHSVGIDAQNNLLEFLPCLKKYTNKCIVVFNGIEVDRFKDSAKRDFRKELNLLESSFLIGFLGRFMSQKGFIYLIEALELLLNKNNLPKTPVILALGHGGFIREEMGMIKKKGLEGLVHFLPFAHNIAPSLKGLDVVAMPSLWEASGLLAMEALVAGVPLVASNCIGIRESLHNTPGVMVPAGNSPALADALEHEMKNASRQRAEAFRDKAATRFDVRKQANRLEDVITGLLNSG